jgi:ribosome-interacting GTPase 1
MKDKYIKMRNTGKYDLQWFYDYYRQNSGDSIDINKFGMVFNSVNLDNILEHIDRKLKLVRIYDKNNNFIKVYEGTADTSQEN